MNDFEGFVGPFSKHPMLLFRSNIECENDLFFKEKIQLFQIQNSTYPIVLLKDLKMNNSEILSGASVGYTGNSDAEREAYSRIRNSRFPIVLVRNLNGGIKKDFCTEKFSPSKVDEAGASLLTLKNELDSKLQEGEKNLAALQAMLLETTFRSGGDSFQCLICGYETKRKSSAKNHAVTHSDTKIFTCSTCDYGTSRKDVFKKHFDKHLSEYFGSFNDEDASYLKEQWNKINSHNLYESVHTTSTSAIENTPETLETLTNELTMQLEEGKKKLAVMKEELLKTSFRCIGDALQCSVCSYETKHKNHAKNHALIHCDTKIFSCPKCGYGTSRDDSFKEHIKKHLSDFSVHEDMFSEDKNPSEEYQSNNISNSRYPSEVVQTTSKCDSAVETALVSLRHELEMKLQNGEGKLAIMQAELLETTFRREEGVFHCVLCGYDTKRKDCARKHALIHSDAKIFTCSNCDYGTSSNYRFKQHFERHMAKVSVHRDRSKNDTSVEQSGNISDTQHDFDQVHTTANEAKCENYVERNFEKISVNKLNDTNEKQDSKLFTCSNCNFKTSVEVLNEHNLRHWSKCLRCDYITESHIRSSAENGTQKHSLMPDVKEEPNSECNMEDNHDVILSSSSDSNFAEFSATEYLSLSINSPQKISPEQYMESLSPAIKDVRDQIFGLTMRAMEDSFQCSQCEYETKHKGNAKEHALVHSTIKLFQCRECDYGTNRAVKLKRHLDTHTLFSSSGKSQKCNTSPYKREDNADEIVSDNSLVCHKEGPSCNNVSSCKIIEKERSVTNSLTFANSIKDIPNSFDISSDKMPEYSTDIPVPFPSPEKINTSFTRQQDPEEEAGDTLSLFASSENTSSSKSSSPIGKRKRQETESQNGSSFFSKKKRQEIEEATFDFRDQLLSSIGRDGNGLWICSICNVTAKFSTNAKRHAITHFSERVSEFCKLIFNVKNGIFECSICLYSTLKPKDAKYHSVTHFKRNFDENKTNEEKASKNDRVNAIPRNSCHSVSKQNDIQDMPNGSESRHLQSFASINDTEKKSSHFTAGNDEDSSHFTAGNDEPRKVRKNDLSTLFKLKSDLVQSMCDDEARDIEHVQRDVHSVAEEVDSDEMNLDGNEVSRIPSVGEIEIAEDDEQKLVSIRKQVFESTMEKAVNGFHCLKCNYETKRKHRATLHAFTHTDVKLYKCSVCEYGTYRSDSYRHHLLKHKTKLTSLMKGESREFRELLESTFQVVEGSFHCSICNYETRVKSCAAEHSLTHAKTRLFCPQCDYNTDQKQMYDIHLRIHESASHGKTSIELHHIYMCSQCDWTSSLFDDFQSHLTSHNRAKQIQSNSTTTTTTTTNPQLNDSPLTSPDDSECGEETNQQVVPQPISKELICTDFVKVFIKEEPELPEAMELDPLEHDIFRIKEELILPETADEGDDLDN